MSDDLPPRYAERQCLADLLALIPALRATPARLYQSVSACLAAFPLTPVRLYTNLPYLVSAHPNEISMRGYAYGWIEGMYKAAFLTEVAATCGKVFATVEQFTFAQFCCAHPDLVELKTVPARQRQVLTLLREGYQHHEIAHLLVMAPDTASTHVRNLRSKFGENTGAKVVRLADAAGLFHYLCQ